jgi:hypothetical protein
MGVSLCQNTNSGNNFTLENHRNLQEENSKLKNNIYGKDVKINNLEEEIKEL